MGLTIQEYREKTKGQFKVGDLIKQDKADLVITGEEDIERAKENSQRVMMNIQKPFMDMYSPITQMFRNAQRQMDQLASPILKMSSPLSQMSKIMQGPEIMLNSIINPYRNLDRLLIPSIAAPFFAYIKRANEKRAYFFLLIKDDEALDLWLSEHIEDYQYALEEGKLYRYGARKGAMICEAIAFIPTTEVVGLEHWLARYVEREYGEKSLRTYLLKAYFKSRRGREERYVLVDGKYIEDTSDIEDIDNLVEEVERITLKYLMGFKKLPEKEQRQFLLYGIGFKKYLHQVFGNKNKATVAMRTAKRRMEEEEYLRFLKGIEELRALTLELGREEKVLIGYLICLMCNLPIKIVTFF
jgi:hypothetical protein